MQTSPIEELGALLRMWRNRVPPEAHSLGSLKRPPNRCGHRVSQEEVAEVVGVSRNWYRLLESGSGARASVQLIDRIADAFAFTPHERATLFVLALPELWCIRDTFGLKLSG
jgi:DNA-binding XRE family transcriptional regulator